MSQDVGDPASPSGTAQVDDAGTERHTAPSSRPSRAVAVVAWAALLVFTLASLGSALVGRTVFLGTDLLARMPPWAAALGGRDVVNLWIGDTIDSATPQTVLLKHSVLDGDPAMWNPYLAGGNVLGALPDTGLASPMSWVWFLVPDSYAPGAVKLVEIAVVCLGFVLLGRRLGLSWAARAVASLAFVSTGFMVAWTNWPQTRVAALLPLLFWAVDRAVALRRVRDAAPVALVLAAMLLGGFPAVVGYAAYAAVAYAVVRLAAERVPWRGWLAAAGVGVLGALTGAALAAFQLVPFVHHLRSSVDLESRGQNPSMHLPLTDVATALVPGMFGDAGDGPWAGTGNPVERFSYLGLGALVLVAAATLVRGGRVRRAVALYAVVGAGVCAVLVYVGGLPLAVAQELPVFSDNLVTRLRVMTGFLVALAAALGFDRLVEHAASQDDRAPRSSRVRSVVVGVLLAGGAAVAALAVRRALYLLPAERIDQARTETLVVAGVGLACLLLAAGAVVGRRRWARVVGVVVPVLVAGQALVVVDGWWPRSDPETFYPATATHEFLREHLGEDRYASVGQAMLPGSSSLYEMRSATGHGFHAPAWREMLVAAYPDAMLSPTYSVLDLDTLDSGVLDRMAVRYAVADPGLPPRGEPRPTGEAVGTATATATAPATTVPLQGPVRGVLLELPEGLPDGGAVRVEVVGDDGAVVAATEPVLRAPGPGTQAWVALAADGLGPDAGWTLRVVPVGVDAVVVPADTDGAWAPTVARPEDDGLRVVHTGEATVYERTNALPRVRWASDVVVEPDADAAYDLMRDGALDPTQVVLEEPGTADAGSRARVDVLEEGTDGGTLRVTADGAGYLVVADSLRTGGWTVRVDGEPVDVLAADGAMAAVRVDAGEHEVVLAYEAPGWRTGWAITAVGWVVLLVVVAPALLSRVVRRRRAADGERDGGGGA